MRKTCRICDLKKIQSLYEGGRKAAFWCFFGSGAEREKETKVMTIYAKVLLFVVVLIIF